MAVNVGSVAKTIAVLGARGAVAAQARLDEQVLPRLAATAEERSRLVILTARVDVANTALRRWGFLLYERTPLGVLANVSLTGQILIPVPWSRTQHAAYGLSDPDARILSACVRQMADNLAGRYRVLVYEEHERRWYLSHKFMPPTAEGFRAWLSEHFTVTVDMWRENGRASGRGRARVRAQPGVNGGLE